MKFKAFMKEHTFNVLLILLGTFIMGSAYNMFYAESGIVLGGFGGFAMIINHLLSKVGINLSVSIIYLILNSILFVFAIKILGYKFGTYALIGILSYSLFLEVCKFPFIGGTVVGGTDYLLCSIYGGVLCGVGAGLVVRCGASTGGGDMLGCIINYKKPKLSVGWVTICVDVVVICTSIFVYGLSLSLYAIISVFISGKTADLIIEGPKSIKAYYIISKKSEEIANALLNDLNRGVTSYDAYGKYSGKKQDVVMCLVSGYQVAKLKEIIYNIDKNAFIFSVNVKEALGNGFNKLEKRKKILISKKKVKLAEPKTAKNFTQSPSNEDIKEESLPVLDNNIAVIPNIANEDINKDNNSNKN